MSNFKGKQTASLAASYKVDLLFSKGMKSFGEGGLVKECASITVQAFGENSSTKIYISGFASPNDVLKSNIGKAAFADCGFRNHE